jgi:alpha-beta hydrolase superfamily lysophospholipase
VAPTDGTTASDNDRAALARATWPARDGTPIHVRCWPECAPQAGKIWASILIVHGIGEHSGRYERTGRLLAEAGLDVRALDLRGHGLSGGRRVYVRRWADFLDDVEERLEGLRESGRPVVLMGHSMGALIALDYACSDRPAPDLLVLSAPPLDARIPAWQRALAPLMSRVVPTLVLRNPISGEQLSRDPAVGAAYFGDPLVQPRSTTRMGAEFMAAMQRVGRKLDDLSVPTLVIHGAQDTLVPTSVSEPLGDLPGVERRVLPGLRHETLNEPEGPEVVAGIVEWLRRKAREVQSADGSVVPVAPEL